MDNGVLNTRNMHTYGVAHMGTAESMPIMRVDRGRSDEQNTTNKRNV